MCGVCWSHSDLNLWWGLMRTTIKLLLCLPHQGCHLAHGRRTHYQAALLGGALTTMWCLLPWTDLTGWLAYFFNIIAIRVFLVLNHGLRKASHRLIFLLNFNCLIALKINSSSLLLLLLGGMRLYLLLRCIDGNFWLVTQAVRWLIFA